VRFVEQSARKSYRRGTHRLVAPSETLKRFGPLARALGITRIANVTGLDYLGIPVFVAYRPNGRSLSLAQGKGLDRDSAIASALMEAAEFAHAENLPRPTIISSYSAIKSEAQVAELRLLPRRKRFHWSTQKEIAWTRGEGLSDGSEIYVPSELIHLDHTVSMIEESVGFWSSSDGLGAGNHKLEATCSALCELIERDALAIWSLRDPEEQQTRRVSLRTITNDDCCGLFGRYADCNLSVAVWDMTTDIGVACFLCRVRENMTCEHRALGEFWGAGCHLNRDVALARALTEVAQERLTVIAGVRDDLDRDLYARSRRSALFDEVFDDLDHCEASRRYSDVPSDGRDTFEDDLELLLAKLSAAGLGQAVSIDLTDERIGIPVVKIIVPGLEAFCDHGSVRPGPRARIFARSRL
jgi:ribosomal protein S12 methylthiotransferase accessory factor